MERMNSGWIEEALYKRIVAATPILTMDLIVSLGGALLLLKRSIHPAKGLLWMPGGRIGKGEDLNEAARRILWAETGLNLDTFTVPQLQYVMPLYSDVSEWDCSTHTMSMIMKMHLFPDHIHNWKDKIKLDSQSTGYETALVLPDYITKRFIKCFSQ